MAKAKKGISSVIATLLMIVLTVVLVGVAWTVVNNLVKDKIGQSSACFGNFDEITLGDLYTCYNSTGVQFSLSIGNIEVDSVIVTISSVSETKSVTITNELQNIAGLAYYGGGTSVKLPGKSSAITYIYDWTGADVPNSVQIAPTIEEQQCSISDSITPIDNCALLG